MKLDAHNFTSILDYVLGDTATVELGKIRAPKLECYDPASDDANEDQGGNQIIHHKKLHAKNAIIFHGARFGAASNRLRKQISVCAPQYLAPVFCFCS